MSYGAAAALQAAIYQHLAADSTLQGLIGSNIYDDVPPGPAPGTYVSLGIEDVRDRSDKTGRGALHILTVSVVSDAAGFQVAKTVAAAVSDALSGAALSLARGVLVYLAFERARARRVGASDRRRIDLRFRARVDDG